MNEPLFGKVRLGTDIVTGKESDNAARSVTVEVTACFVILEASDFRGTNASSGRSSQDPLALASIGGTNISPLSQLLQNSTAGWTGPRPGQLEQIAQHWGELELQVFDTVLADLTADPFALAWYAGQL